MAYTAPTITDRTADGDNKYTMQTLSDGRTALTPAPDRVVEQGTDINKALLQPLVDTVAALDAARTPYTDYWWRRRVISGTYYETQIDPESGDYASHTTFSYGYQYIYIFSLDHDTTTLSYASTVSINQSSGAVSLASPTTVTVTRDSYSNDQLQSMLKGKYVKGLHPNTSAIFYIPELSYVTTSTTWESSDGTSSWQYTGYVMSDDTSQLSTAVKKVGAAYSEAIGDWEFVSSEDSSTYPHNGALNGWTYEYLGIIKDISLANSSPPPLQTVDFNRGDNVAIPYDRFLFAIGAAGAAGSLTATQIIGIATKSNLQIVGLSMNSKSENGSYNYFTFSQLVAGTTIYSVDAKSGEILDPEIYSNAVTVKVTAAGLTITGTSGTLIYLKL